MRARYRGPQKAKADNKLETSLNYKKKPGLKQNKKIQYINHAFIFKDLFLCV